MWVLPLGTSWCQIGRPHTTRPLSLAPVSFNSVQLCGEAQEEIGLACEAMRPRAMCGPDVAGGQFWPQLDVTSEKEDKDGYMVGAQ